jgi:hypothetical protein
VDCAVASGVFPFLLRPPLPFPLLPLLSLVPLAACTSYICICAVISNTEYVHIYAWERERLMEGSEVDNIVHTNFSFRDLSPRESYGILSLDDCEWESRKSFSLGGFMRKFRTCK